MSLLTIEHATKIYPVSSGFLGEKKEVRALNDFSIVIEEKPASITTIAGESGSGKTTIANLVLGFTSITSGRIKFLG